MFPAQDGDGQFFVQEVEAIVSNLIGMKERVRDLKYVAVAAFVALLAVCGSMLAVSVIGNELSKDVSQSDEGLMMVEGTGVPVQVSSSDMAVSKDGSLVIRSGSNQTSGAALSVRTLTEAVPLTTAMPVGHFHSMKSILIEVDHDEGNTDHCLHAL